MEGVWVWGTGGPASLNKKGMEGVWVWGTGGPASYK